MCPVRCVTHVPGPHSKNSLENSTVSAVGEIGASDADGEKREQKRPYGRGSGAKAAIAAAIVVRPLSRQKKPRPDQAERGSKPSEAEPKPRRKRYVGASARRRCFAQCGYGAAQFRGDL
jgi:hypothetical protein